MIKHQWLFHYNSNCPIVEQELLTLPEHLSSPPVSSGVHVTRSLVLYVCFVDRCLSFCAFSFGYCVVCSSLIYGSWLPLWYLQSLLVYYQYATTVFIKNMVNNYPACFQMFKYNCDYCLTVTLKKVVLTFMM